MIRELLGTFFFEYWSLYIEYYEMQWLFLCVLNVGHWTLWNARLLKASQSASFQRVIWGSLPRNLMLIAVCFASSYSTVWRMLPVSAYVFCSFYNPQYALSLILQCCPILLEQHVSLIFFADETLTDDFRYNSSELSLSL